MEMNAWVYPGPDWGEEFCEDWCSYKRGKIVRVLKDQNVVRVKWYDSRTGEEVKTIDKIELVFPDKDTGEYPGENG